MKKFLKSLTHSTGSELTLSRRKRVKGLTLIEVLIASGILVFCLAAILASFITMFFVADLSRDITRAKNAVQAQMEELKEESFDNLSTYNGTVFDIAGFAVGDAKGRREVRDVGGHPDLKEVRVLASFRVKRRIIGEDTNFNGALDTGEDTNANNRLDSPVEVVTLITR